jgi:hypothetical protein
MLPNHRRRDQAGRLRAKLAIVHRPTVTALLLAFACAACGRSASAVPCPGDAQARLQLEATLVEGAECAAAAGITAAPLLVATVAFTGDAGAALCPARALAEPLAGARTGDAIDVSAPAVAATLTSCSCALLVTERVTGVLARDGTGEAVAFTGELVDEITPAVGGPCGSTGTTACPAPCRMRWTLTGTR